MDKKELIDLVRKAQREVDPQKREELYREVRSAGTPHDAIIATEETSKPDLEGIKALNELVVKLDSQLETAKDYILVAQKALAQIVELQCGCKALDIASEALLKWRR
jgi:hypothetical protein